MEDEDRRLAQRIVSFYQKENEWSETNFEESNFRFMAHLAKAKLQPTQWSSQAKTLLVTSYVAMRNDFSRRNINGYKISRVTTNHLKTIIRIAECFSKLCPQSCDQTVSIVDCTQVRHAIDFLILKNSHFLNLNKDLLNPERIMAVKQAIVDKTAELTNFPLANDYLDQWSP